MLSLNPKLINKLHVFFYVPLLLYASYLGLTDKFVPDWIWYLFIVLAAVAVLFHGPKLMRSLKEGMVVKQETSEEVN